MTRNTDNIDQQSAIAAHTLLDRATGGANTFVLEGAKPCVVVLSPVQRRLLPVCFLHEVTAQDGMTYTHVSFNNKQRTDIRLDFDSVDEATQLMRSEAFRISGLLKGHDPRLAPLRMEAVYGDA